MRDYFKRQIQLWGEATQESLTNKSVAIIGCGGLGCSVGIALSGSGIGTLYLVDFDEVSTHNIHRQIGFELGDEGKNKAHVLSTKLSKRNSTLQTPSFACDFDEFIAQEQRFDLIIDCTDNLATRQKIDEASKRFNIPWIYGSVEEFNGQVCFFEQSSFSAFKVQDRAPQGITAPFVMHIASLQATLALRFLAKLALKKDILHYIYFDNEGELITHKFAMPKE
jgi:molybdopterin/thiamine biosynthesis adenylyltransferase